MKDLAYYDGLAWEIRIERDLRADGSVYYVARHPEFGPIAGPLGTGSTPEEALADLHEARRSLSRSCSTAVIPFLSRRP
jgi:hypothetical protein